MASVAAVNCHAANASRWADLPSTRKVFMNIAIDLINKHPVVFAIFVLLWIVFQIYDLAKHWND